MTKVTEQSKIELCSSSDGSSFGHIALTALAKPETVQITLNGDTIIPESFNIYGEPILSEEMTTLYYWLEKQARRNPETEHFLLEVDVYYETQEFNVPISEFNTVEGIEKSLSNLSTFTEMLNNRRRYIKSTNSRLNEFVIFGRYNLDSFGQIWTLSTYNGSSAIRDVCTLSDFKNLVSSCSASFGGVIPEEGKHCPCCGKIFTIDELRNTTFGLVNGKISHDSCRRNYYHNKEIDEMSRSLIDLVYDEEPKFDLLPNGYCNEDCCKHIPWFLFHTSDGDIQIGQRKHVISIEWQENYKPFDMAIFNDEDVTKWCNNTNIYEPIEEGTLPTNGRRGIHAWNKEDALKYLEKVKETVNSDDK